jgi:hypothetical protein
MSMPSGKVFWKGRGIILTHLLLEEPSDAGLDGLTEHRAGGDMNKPRTPAGLPTRVQVVTDLEVVPNLECQI